MRTHDFRQRRWGHALHGGTWQVLEPRTQWRWFRWPIRHPRFSVMVHVPAIEVGDRVIYKGARGTLIADVVDVEGQTGVYDMFLLTLENIRPHEEEGR